jgi:hypothetical protein
MENQIIIQYNSEKTKLISIQPVINEDGIFITESMQPKIFDVSELSAADKKIFDSFVNMVNSKLQ